MKPHLSALLLCLIGCQTTSDKTPEPTHMLRLICDGADKTGLQSRVAVLDIDDPTYDYGFTAGHSVPTERPCAVKDFHGKSQPVNLIRFANGYESGAKTDWAIIRFNKMSTKGLVRYELDPIDDLRLLDKNKFYFAQARGLAENAQSCNLSILDFNNGHNRAAHDCRAISGQSGSPITRQVEGKHQLVGLHIGQLWMFQSPETGRPDRKGYINLLDASTVKEIEGLISASQN